MGWKSLPASDLGAGLRRGAWGAIADQVFLLPLREKVSAEPTDEGCWLELGRFINELTDGRFDLLAWR